MQYREGIWCTRSRSPHTIARVAELCRGGQLLEFGCGEGNLPYLLPPGSFSEYMGIDISEVAIRKASARAAQAGVNNCHFQQGDMAKWDGSFLASLILVEECLYYLSLRDIERFLSRCCSSLSRDGVILVIVHCARKHSKTLSVCRRVCRVVDERSLGSRAFLTLASKSSAPL